MPKAIKAYSKWSWKIIVNSLPFSNHPANGEREGVLVVGRSSSSLQARHSSNRRHWKSTGTQITHPRSYKLSQHICGRGSGCYWGCWHSKGQWHLSPPCRSCSGTWPRSGPRRACPQHWEVPAGHTRTAWRRRLEGGSHCSPSGPRIDPVHGVERDCVVLERALCPCQRLDVFALNVAAVVICNYKYSKICILFRFWPPWYADVFLFRHYHCHRCQHKPCFREKPVGGVALRQVSRRIHYLCYDINKILLVLSYVDDDAEMTETQNRVTRTIGCMLSSVFVLTVCTFVLINTWLLLNNLQSRGSLGIYKPRLFNNTDSYHLSLHIYFWRENKQTGQNNKLTLTPGGHGNLAQHTHNNYHKQIKLETVHW